MRKLDKNNLILRENPKLRKNKLYEEKSIIPNLNIVIVGSDIKQGVVAVS